MRVNVLPTAVKEDEEGRGLAELEGSDNVEVDSLTVFASGISENVHCSVAWKGKLYDMAVESEVLQLIGDVSKR